MYQPRFGEAFSVELKPGTYHYAWFNPARSEEGGAGGINVPGGSQQFQPPFESDAVLWLKRVAVPESAN